MLRDPQLVGSNPTGAPPSRVDPVPRGRQLRVPGRTEKFRLRGLAFCVLVLWVLIVGDPLRWPAYYGAHFLLQIPIPVLVVTLLAAALTYPLKAPLPLLAFATYAIIQTPFAYNIGHAMPVARVLVSYCALGVVTLTVIRTPRQAVPVVAWVLVFQYTWWTLVGAVPGRVTWHTLSYDNYDGFGPMMAIGIGASYFMAVAAKNRKARLI